MKHFRLFTAILAALMITSVVLFNACSKQENDLQSIEPGNEQQLSPRDLNINKIIKAFRTEVDYIREHPAYKSGESYDADSAIWLLEATINYSHTFPNDYYGQLITDTLYLTLSTNDAGKVDMNELAQKYNEMKAAISQVYHSKAIDDKGLVLVNLEDISFKSDEVIIEMMAVTGERTNEPPGGFGISGPFEEGDDWWYGEDKGHCPPHTLESDAADQLWTAMNNTIPDPGNNYYFSNLTTVTKTGGDPALRRPTDPNPPDNDFDYYLYNASDAYGTITDDVLCLGYEEMNYYYSYLYYLIYEKIPGEDVPAAYSIESIINMTGTHEQIILGMHYFHRCTFQYGLKVNYDDDQEPSEI